MKEEAEKFLTLVQKYLVSETEIQIFTERLKCSIKDNPLHAKELAQLMSQIKKVAKDQVVKADIKWIQLGNGFLAIGHKPGGKIAFIGLKNMGASAVLTLLHENEGALEIGKQTKNIGLEWIWFPFSASRPEENKAKIVALYTHLQHLLDNRSKIYIHCSAGIHRTGMITYGLLRFIGLEKNEALQHLKLLRIVTAEQVGEDRLLWADQYAKL